MNRSVCSRARKSSPSASCLLSSKNTVVSGGRKSNGSAETFFKRGISTERRLSETPLSSISQSSPAIAERRAAASGVFAEAAAVFRAAASSFFSPSSIRISVAASTSARSVKPIFSRVCTSYSLILSISSPKKSTRTGFLRLTGKISRMSPRREKQPSASTISSRVYPAAARRFTAESGSISIPFSKTSTSSFAGKSCSSASKVVTAISAPRESS